MHRILILDDEPRLGTLLQRSLERDGYEVAASTDPHAALELLKEQRFDVLVTDLRMPGLDGLEVLLRSKSISPMTEVILITAHATVETAREALKRGAVDYLVKPISAEKDLKPLLARLLADAPSRGEDAPEPAAPVGSPPPHAGERDGAMAVLPSPAMRAVLAKAEKVARSDASVLLRGESGVGKEVLADYIQAHSPRRSRPYLKINCGALPETLLESELFGHVRGAFTGAVSDRDGLFASAHGGTVLLDEVGEISPALQVKLLRVLQSGEYSRVGESTLRRADARVIAATNRDLEKMIARGEFRQDLYYRLNVVPIVAPPLRERPDDIDALVDAFTARFARGRDVRFGDDARAALRAYHWPGNIRELENAVEHAIVLADGDVIGVGDLPAAVQEWGAGGYAGAASSVAAGAGSLEEIEIRCLLAALRKTHGNRTRAAGLLGITRRTLGYRIRKYDLEDEVERIAAGARVGDSPPARPGPIQDRDTHRNDEP